MDRYHRQRLLPGIGDAGQERLGRARALIVGCGALGCASADLLARAGIGGLTLVDRDLVEITNLQRQVLFDEAHALAHEPKAVAAAERLSRINGSVRTEPVVADFSARNAEGIAMGTAGSPPDVILDGTDNFETRFLINDLAVKLGVPYLYAGAVGTRAMTAAFLPDGTSPCLRCVFDSPPPAGSQPTCDTAGVLGPVIATVAGVQSSEAIKVIIGAHDRVRRTMLEFDAWENSMRELDLSPLRDPACPCCGARTFGYLDAPRAEPVAICGRDAFQISPAEGSETGLDLDALAGRLARHGSFSATRFLVRGTLDGERPTGCGTVGLTVFRDGRALVQGVNDPGEAKSVYAKYIGS